MRGAGQASIRVLMAENVTPPPGIFQHSAEEVIRSHVASYCTVNGFSMRIWTLAQRVP